MGVESKVLSQDEVEALGSHILACKVGSKLLEVEQEQEQQDGMSGLYQQVSVGEVAVAVEGLKFVERE